MAEQARVAWIISTIRAQATAQAILLFFFTNHLHRPFYFRLVHERHVNDFIFFSSNHIKSFVLKHFQNLLFVFLVDDATEILFYVLFL